MKTSGLTKLKVEVFNLVEFKLFLFVFGKINMNVIKNTFYGSDIISRVLSHVHVVPYL